MTWPLLILAVPAVLAGFANIDKDFEHLLIGALPTEVHVEESHFVLWIALVSTAVPLAGIGLAYLIYSAQVVSSARLARAFGPVHRLLENKYYLDVLYERVIVGYLFYQVLGGALTAFDRLVVDGAVNGVGKAISGAATGLRYAQSGQFQTYGAFAFSSLLFATILILVLSPL
jgi:NADH-quinone oxidoreductase subunit L